MKSWNKYEIGILNVGYLLVVTGIVINLLHYRVGLVLLAIGIVISVIDFVLSLFKLEWTIRIRLPFGRDDNSEDEANILDIPDSKVPKSLIYEKFVNAMYYLSGAFILLGVVLKVLHYPGGNASMVLGALLAVIWWLLHLFSTRIK